MTVDATTGIVAWRPTAAQVGEQAVILRVQDGQGGITLQALQVYVNPALRPPTFMALPDALAQAGVNVPFQFQIQARNPALDPLTFRLVTAATGVSLDPTTGLFRWTPAAAGTYSFAITADDGKGGQTTQSFQLQAVLDLPNANPVITSTPPSRMTALGLPYVYKVQATDPNHDALTYQLNTAPAGMTIDSSGNLFWQPQPQQLGTHTIAVQVSDGRGGSVIQQFELTVASSATLTNQAPTFTSTPRRAATVGQDYQYVLKLSDLDNDQLLVSLQQALDGMFLDPDQLTLHWIPTVDQLGDSTVILQVQDAQGATTTQAFALTVRAVNTPPLITSTPITQAALNKPYVLRRV